MVLLIIAVPKHVLVSNTLDYRWYLVHLTHFQLHPVRLGLPISNVAISTQKALKQAKGKYLCLISDYLCSYFREVSKLVFQHAAAIPRERVSLFFRHAVLHLYGYLYFKPL